MTASGPPSRRLRIDLAYDGGPYRGFARQPDQTTVQGTLEGALSRLLQVEDIEVTCAGRTDRGVHAAQQTVHVDVPADTPRLADLPALRTALDGMVGPTITIWRVRPAPPGFHARFSAYERRYRFRIWDQPAMPPLLAASTWHVGRALDVGAMDEASQALVGTHDFTTFCRRRVVTMPDGSSHDATLVRRIEELRVRRSRPSGLILIGVRGSAFCHTMVRAITGSLLEVGLGERDPAWMGTILAARDRSIAGPVAPPHGLSLMGVRYHRTPR